MAKALGKITSQAVVANNMVYWGSWDGLEHASRLSDGTDVWAVNLGQTTGSCIKSTYGVLSTATVASLSINGVTTPVVFVGGGNANLYALDGNNGTIIWQTVLATTPAHFIYSSTALFNGSVYVGVSSFGDCPLLDGSIVQVNATTGQIQNTFHSVPPSCRGGSVWGSLAIDEVSGMLYFGTGNKGKCLQPEPLVQSLVELNATDLSFVDSWIVPVSEAVNDGDFGSTPTLFQATISGVQHMMVGLVNKNGIFYAFDRANISGGPLWETRISVGGASPENGQGSISSSADDGTTLYVAGGNTTIQGVACGGSLQALDANSGTILWQLCLKKPVLAPVMAAPGLVIVGFGHFLNVVNAATGTVLFNFRDSDSTSKFWGAATVSNGVLYIGTKNGTLYAFGL
jgi:outer membrane protein assembly factor BamB